MVAELIDPSDAEDARTPWLRVTSVRTNAETADIAGKLLGLDRTELAQQGWTLAEEQKSVTHVIDGTERGGTRIELSRDTAPGSPATYTQYAWNHDGSVNMLRTIGLSGSPQMDTIDAVIDSLSVPSIQLDSVRRVGVPEYWFRIPATWETQTTDLPEGHTLRVIATPAGRIEVLLTALQFGTPRSARETLLSQVEERMTSLEAHDQGENLGERRAWLNIEGTLIAGVIRSWRMPDGKEIELPSFTYVPAGVDRAVQIQTYPEPGAEADSLAVLKFITSQDVDRREPLALAEAKLSFGGLRAILPRGLDAAVAVGDTLAEGQGAVFGDPDDGGPRLFFWSMPNTEGQADLATRQAAWMDAWLARDFPDAEVTLRQTVAVTPLAGTPYKGLAWTLDHARQLDVSDSAKLYADPIRWMCMLVAIPYRDQTYVAALQVDDRDRDLMMDEFKEAVRRSFSANTFSAEAQDFELHLPHGGPWSLFAQPGPDGEHFSFLHVGGRVQARLEHFDEEFSRRHNPAGGGSSTSTRPPNARTAPIIRSQPFTTTGSRGSATVICPGRGDTSRHSPSTSSRAPPGSARRAGSKATHASPGSSSRTIAPRSFARTSNCSSPRGASASISRL